ncbi:hypothetical protein A2X44_03520 [candidate division CPR3 bacterium GWF2_35_18]|uniref:Metallo-beta-lactamase domain-containing protein 1 n=1 Tax=candidate division CPR3 bacterium GW2011_GWF2_35_18 TaxID=1618350 RepID=A0A0G0C0C8_UNCC3|nr:MAG: hypothetical protein UR67_C0005G0065 [candidate division CPR3 bacterium GW2011_GWF2_35_18]KKP85110.1 MAG: hypothetical protein UR87_C0059G0003 [candidate division CPR3 bacterium GW2011_GWE2_35_7]OGB63049.1 MAG: hypothetical protein A2X44_03520 [candidate division CPR3 bacterium GWF2_35_18]OGB63927.1 MAG: hypothetical protein A2250_02685 [candidate division CPR3 bacterium RIFOXYA2_FULL_35_13]OGB76164.1 MAG: hypothetical protein A2476_04550 [candidate division CPR3 bacterium RIFOXYC2_FULL
MAKISVLIEGYVNLKEKNEIFEHNCTVVLIETKGKKIIFDPGLDRSALLKSLEKHELKVEDITHVFLSHNHIDHCLLMGIFPKAKVCTSVHFYNSNGYGKMIPEVLGDEVEIVHTPGHLQNHYSLLVNNEEKQKVLIAGDLWWWAINEEQKVDYKSLINKDDYFGKDLNQTKKIREKIIKKVDVVIPGHGKSFKINHKEK